MQCWLILINLRKKKKTCVKKINATVFHTPQIFIGRSNKAFPILKKMLKAVNTLQQRLFVDACSILPLAPPMKWLNPPCLLRPAVTTLASCIWGALEYIQKWKPTQLTGEHCDRVTVHTAFPNCLCVEILSNWETFLVAKVGWWPWSITECVRPMRRLLDFRCHVETQGTAQAEVEPGGPRQALLATGPLVSSLTPTGPVEGKGNNSETAVLVIGSWRWYHPQQVRKNRFTSSTLVCASWHAARSSRSLNSSGMKTFSTFFGEGGSKRCKMEQNRTAPSFVLRREKWSN